MIEVEDEEVVRETEKEEEATRDLRVRFRFVVADLGAETETTTGKMPHTIINNMIDSLIFLQGLEEGHHFDNEISIGSTTVDHEADRETTIALTTTEDAGLTETGDHEVNHQ